MANRVHPVVGQWYERRDKGGLFQVVALDEDAGTIDIQEFDGDVDELDLESWREMGPEEAAAPEDWSGPVGELDADELGYTDLEAAEPALEQAATSWEEIVEEDEDLAEEPPARTRGPAAPRRH